MTKRNLLGSGELNPLHVDRRRFLRGLGVCVAAPALESLVPRGAWAAGAPAPATTASGAPLRMAFMSVPNGVHQDYWFPKGEGKEFQFNRTMAPLESLRKHVQIISGLDHENATPGADGPGDHARANATFLTGQRARKTGGKDIHVGVSVDQAAAQAYGRATRFPSLELSCDAVRNSGACDSGYACAYQYNISWSSATTPVAAEPNPRLVFERLFGAGSPGERQKSLAARRESQRSVLDFVLEDAKSIRRRLGASDRPKLDEYLTSVRSLEKRLDAAEGLGAPPDPDRPTPLGIPDNFGEHMDLMYDLVLLAFQTDSTRVATLLLAHDGSNRTFPDLGIIEGHHYLTHNMRKEEIGEKVAEIDAYYMQRFARFLEQLDEIEDVDGNSLLHNSMIVYGGAIADGNRHTHRNLPVVLAGEAGGAFASGRHLRAGGVPMSNLFVEMLNTAGVGAEGFGDSTGAFEAIRA